MTSAATTAIVAAAAATAAVSCKLDLCSLYKLEDLYYSSEA